MIKSQGKGVTLVEHGAQLLPKQDNLLDDGIGMFLQEFIENLALFR